MTSVKEYIFYSKEEYVWKILKKSKNEDLEKVNGGARDYEALKTNDLALMLNCNVGVCNRCGRKYCTPSESSCFAKTGWRYSPFSYCPSCIEALYDKDRKTDDK